MAPVHEDFVILTCQVTSNQFYA